MSIVKLYEKKKREVLYNNIMSDVNSNSAYIITKDTGKWISLDMLEDILTVHILRAKTGSEEKNEKKR